MIIFPLHYGNSSSLHNLQFSYNKQAVITLYTFTIWKYLQMKMIILIYINNIYKYIFNNLQQIVGKCQNYLNF